MTPLDAAILQLEGQLDSLGAFAPVGQRPAEGTKDWFILRAVAAGLSTLRQMAIYDLHADARGAERFYLASIASIKAADPIAEPLVATPLPVSR